MTNGDESTREDAAAAHAPRSGGGRRGGWRARRSAPDSSPAPDAGADPSTDELETVEDASTVARPSVLPPDVAAARTAMHRRTMEIPLVDPAHPYGEDDEVDPIATPEPETEPEPHHDAAHPPRVVVERRWPLYVTISVLVVLLMGVSTLAAYLWHVADEWEAQVVELTDVSYGLGGDLAAERESLAAAEERIELLTDQLSSSKDSVTRLQAENAQWGDDAAFAQEQITRLRDLISAGTAATASMTRCIDAHGQLITYLETPDDYEPEEIAAYRESVDELCTEAANAVQRFTSEASAS